MHRVVQISSRFQLATLKQNQSWNEANRRNAIRNDLKFISAKQKFIILCNSKSFYFWSHNTQFNLFIGTIIHEPSMQYLVHLLWFIWVRLINHNECSRISLSGHHPCYSVIANLPSVCERAPGQAADSHPWSSWKGRCSRQWTHVPPCTQQKGSWKWHSSHLLVGSSCALSPS